MESDYQAASQEDTTPSRTTTTSSILGKLLVLFIIDAFASWFIISQFVIENIALAVAALIIAVFVNIVIWRAEFYPIRWMLIGLVLMSMFAIYPILYNIVISTTNYGFGNLLTKEQVINHFENIKYLPDEGGAFTWTAYVSEDGRFAVWLQAQDGSSFLALPNQSLAVVQPGESGVGELDADGIPVTIEGFERLNRLTVVRHINDLGELNFGEGDQVIKITGLGQAAELEPAYLYDEQTDTLTDQRTGEVYSPVEGTFTSATGDVLRPGYQTFIGLQNFVEFFRSPAVRGPLVLIIIWNFAFAFLSVATTFALGLGVALIFNDRSLPGRKLITTLLLIPYAIPSLISVMVWRGMFNPELGIINQTLTDLIGWAPRWFTDPFWAKTAILIINLWLGYPYFMLICSGALQAIPTDIYGAAEVDGANVWQRFRKITLPLLLVAVGPLLVASFVFNFNNFNVIFLFIAGGPPIAGAATEAGHTDILISYVYNLAFEGGRGAQYGFAAAITMIIFIVVAVITLLQFRWTRMWEEVGENV
ncbi:MAG: maltose ABC transporter permease MalF [Anaerolineales bacterium]|nr:maltose ABC transporter permease MalF [Anaerolineales bacterium]